MIEQVGHDIMLEVFGAAGGGHINNVGDRQLVSMPANKLVCNNRAHTVPNDGNSEVWPGFGVLNEVPAKKFHASRIERIGQCEHGLCSAEHEVPTDFSAGVDETFGEDLWEGSSYHHD